MDQRTSLPPPLIEAIESLVQAAQNFGSAQERHLSVTDATERIRAAEIARFRMIGTRKLLLDAIEQYGSTMFEGGIDVGPAR